MTPKNALVIFGTVLVALIVGSVVFYAKKGMPSFGRRPPKAAAIAAPAPPPPPGRKIKARLFYVADEKPITLDRIRSTCDPPQDRILRGVQVLTFVHQHELVPPPFRCRRRTCAYRMTPS